MTTRLYLVRHGQASATWADAADPGLSEQGRQEAEAAAQIMAPRGPMPILSSPLARAKETAAPLERLWESHARIEPGVAEVPTPDLSVADRGPWLQKLMQGTWSDADEYRRNWRDSVVATLVGQTRTCVIFSHFIAINVAWGAAEADDRLVGFSPANASITIFETDGKRLKLIEQGAQASTVVR